jgi:prepilin-type N-terminal cleavage/methylation domain-containing protein
MRLIWCAASARPRARRGVSLIELIIVVAALAIIASVTALVMPAKIVPPDDTAHRIANARTKALRTGRPVSVVVQLDSVYAIATAMPDGSVLADSGAHVDRLTGRVARINATSAGTGR